MILDTQERYSLNTKQKFQMSFIFYTARNLINQCCSFSCSDLKGIKIITIKKLRSETFISLALFGHKWPVVLDNCVTFCFSQATQPDSFR